MKQKVDDISFACFYFQSLLSVREICNQCGKSEIHAHRSASPSVFPDERQKHL